jgi:hypothetical protein
MPLLDGDKYAGPKESLTANPSNGSSFTMNQLIEISVPMRQDDNVCEFKNGFVSFDITGSEGTATNIASLQAYAGTMGLVDQQVIKTSTGTEFSNFDGYNVLAPLLIQNKVDTNWYNGSGKILFGTNNDSNKGSSVEGATTNNLETILA